MIRSVFVFITLSILIASCNKDNIPQGSKLSKISRGGVVNSEYLYNAQGDLLKTTSHSNEESFFYGSDGKLIKIKRAYNLSSNSASPKFERSYSELIYNSDGRLDTSKNYLFNGTAYQHTSTTLPEYGISGRIISNTVLLPSGQPASKSVYQYDSHGNVVVMELYQYNTSPALTHKSTYEYDDKNNPYLNIGVPPYSVSKNNITKTVQTNYVITPGKPVITTSVTVYKSYNVNGFPTLVNENGNDYIYEYQ